MAPSTRSIFDHAPARPAFERRGLMLDISRNRVPTMDWLKTLIDALALLRYNELQLYTEHTFAYQTHGTVWKQASPMTAAEIREIDAYCSARGIELVPNQNSFAHLERWLRHPDYKHLAECPDGFEHPIAGWRTFGGTLAPTAESAAFIDTLYQELLPNFKSKRLHIGCDEPWELGQGRSQMRVDREGKHLLYLEFLNRLFALAEKHQHQAQFWADIILERPDLVPQLPKNVTPVIWGYEADSPLSEHCRIVAQAGFENNFYVAPGAGNWNSFSGRLDVAEANIKLAAQEGPANMAQRDSYSPLGATTATTNHGLHSFPHSLWARKRHGAVQSTERPCPSKSTAVLPRAAPQAKAPPFAHSERSTRCCRNQRRPTVSYTAHFLQTHSNLADLLQSIELHALQAVEVHSNRSHKQDSTLKSDLSLQLNRTH